MWCQAKPAHSDICLWSCASRLPQKTGEQTNQQCTCLAVHLDFLYQKLLELANLHDLVLHGLCAVDGERLRLSLATSWPLGLLFQNLHHLASLSLCPGLTTQKSSTGLKCGPVQDLQVLLVKKRLRSNAQDDHCWQQTPFGRVLGGLHHLPNQLQMAAQAPSMSYIA